MNEPYKVVLLSRHHDRENFDCGEDSLNEFLKRFARQNADKGLSRTFVAVKGDEAKIYGYYTLSSGSVGFDVVPENLLRYPVPVVHLGRLAVDLNAQGEHLGKALFFHALERSAKLADELGIYAVEVYALNERAREFYLRFGLVELEDDRSHLYLPIRPIKKLLASA